jgi:hypothetical protein
MDISARGRGHLFSVVTKQVTNPEVQCPINKGTPVIPILSQINPIPSIDSFKTYFNIALQSMSRPSLEVSSP